MPILYVHGVNTRSRDGFCALKSYLERHVASAISKDPGSVTIDDVYWGDLAATFAWDGDSRPRSRLLGQGAEDLAPALRRLTNAADVALFAQIPATALPSSSGGGLTSGEAATAPTLRLRGLSPEVLSNYLAVLLRLTIRDPVECAMLTLRADDLAHDPGFQLDLARTANIAEEKDLLFRHMEIGQSNLVGMGGGLTGWLKDLSERLDEGLRRAQDTPAFALTTFAGELRRPLNDFVSVFMGDVLVYLRTRGTPEAPGAIPGRVLDKLASLTADSKSRTNEPLVVFSHSMGGQLVYDALTAFLPPASPIRVDFWCATASQVGFFEEMKLFLASRPEYRKHNPVPFPPHLGQWWNVWDYNDFISYTVNGIVNGVDDGSFDSGMSLMDAHGGYLACPSFYRLFAQKLTARFGQP